MRFSKAGAIPVLAALVLPGLSHGQQLGEWLVAPYIWASDVSWDTAERGGGDIPFGDLVDKLDGAGLIRVEYTRNKIGFTFDYIGMSLSERRSFEIGPVLNVLQANLDLTTFEAGAFYRPSATDHGFDFIAGIRNMDVDSNVILTIGDTQPQRFDTGDSFADVYLGARYLHRFNDAWDFSIRCDYGFGGSDGALNIMTGVGWRSRGVFGMSLVYRHFEFEFDQRIEGETATSEFAFSGPALGFLFRF
jgi:hypothetical protein